jgi:hypothetical protein
MKILSVLLIFSLNPVNCRPFDIPWNSDTGIYSTLISNQFSGYMHTQIRLGSPAQTLDVEIDFSSTDFYVIDSPTAFNSAASTSLTRLTEQFTAHYHGEQQSGTQARDKIVNVNNRLKFYTPIQTDTSVPLKFGIIDRPTNKLTNSRVAGVLGLGLWKNAGTSFTEALLDQASSRHVNFYVSS